MFFDTEGRKNIVVIAGRIGGFDVTRDQKTLLVSVNASPNPSEPRWIVLPFRDRGAEIILERAKTGTDLTCVALRRVVKRNRGEQERFTPLQYYIGHTMDILAQLVETQHQNDESNHRDTPPDVPVRSDAEQDTAEIESRDAQDMAAILTP